MILFRQPNDEIYDVESCKSVHKSKVMLSDDHKTFQAKYVWRSNLFEPPDRPALNEGGGGGGGGREGEKKGRV